jgi:hypothetical protein
LISPTAQNRFFQQQFHTIKSGVVLPASLPNVMQRKQLSQRVAAVAAAAQVSAAEALIGALSLDIPGEAPFSSTLIDSPHLARYWQAWR